MLLKVAILAQVKVMATDDDISLPPDSDVSLPLDSDEALSVARQRLHPAKTQLRSS